MEKAIIVFDHDVLSQQASKLSTKDIWKEFYHSGGKLKLGLDRENDPIWLSIFGQSNAAYCRLNPDIASQVRKFLRKAPADMISFDHSFHDNEIRNAKRISKKKIHKSVRESTYLSALADSEKTCGLFVVLSESSFQRAPKCARTISLSSLLRFSVLSASKAECDALFLRVPEELKICVHEKESNSMPSKYNISGEKVIILEKGSYQEFQSAISKSDSNDDDRMNEFMDVLRRQSEDFLKEIEMKIHDELASGRGIFLQTENADTLTDIHESNETSLIDKISEYISLAKDSAQVLKFIFDLFTPS